MLSPITYKHTPACRASLPRPVEVEITAPMYEYVTAGNGVFLQARRPELAVTFPVAEARIKGLANLETKVRLGGGPVPRRLTEEIVRRSLEAAGDGATLPREVLFHLLYDAGGGGWQLVLPDQVQTETSVTPVEDGPASSYARAVIEVHSHNLMPPVFSEWDDRDEQGFRLFGVIGDFGCEDKCPSLRLRIGVYGNFHEIPAVWAFEMPSGLLDAVAIERRQITIGG